MPKRPRTLLDNFKLQTYKNTYKTTNLIIYLTPFQYRVYTVLQWANKKKVEISCFKWANNDNKLIFCAMGDLYLISDINFANNYLKLTSNGQFSAISYGIHDWIYQGKPKILD